MLTKVCKDCGESLPLSSFHKSKTERFGVRSRCKECRKIHQDSTGERRRRNRNYNLRKYGLTYEDLEDIHKAQDGKCAICNTEISLLSGKHNKSRSACVDHNHSTGAVRGLLCVNCNKGLGSFKDSKKNLAKAIEYLNDRGTYGD